MTPDATTAARLVDDWRRAHQPAPAPDPIAPPALDVDVDDPAFVATAAELLPGVVNLQALRSRGKSGGEDSGRAEEKRHHPEPTPEQDLPTEVCSDRIDRPRRLDGPPASTPVEYQHPHNHQDEQRGQRLRECQDAGRVRDSRSERCDEKRWERDLQSTRERRPRAHVGHDVEAGHAAESSRRVKGRAPSPGLRRRVALTATTRTASGRSVATTPSHDRGRLPGEGEPNPPARTRQAHHLAGTIFQPPLRPASPAAEVHEAPERPATARRCACGASLAGRRTDCRRCSRDCPARNRARLARRRARRRAAGRRPGTCRVCGRDVEPQVGPGRPRRFCSEACRVALVDVDRRAARRLAAGRFAPDPGTR